jgi:signal transduction histidine kinase/sugar lactone lactonase YvrE/ActR/RegA family two-component response regulator
MQGSVRGLLSWVLFGVATMAQAAIPQTPRFRTWQVGDGLPSSQVTAIAQDRAGYLWFGTKDGLARFDGAAFEVHRHDPLDRHSLPGNGISALHVDRQGRLWAGIDGHGVVRMDPRNGRFVHLSPERTPLPDDNVWAIASTPDGSTWFGTYSKGLYRLSATGTWRRFAANVAGADRLPSDAVPALAVDARGILFAGTGKGLVRWTGTRFEPEPVADLDAPRVVMLEADAEGLWVGTTQGLRVRLRSGAFVAPPWQAALAAPVFATRRDRFGVRWLATATGLVKVEGGVPEPVRVGAPHGFASGRTLLEDAEGGMWIAQRGFGVLASPASWRKFATFGADSGSARASVTWARTFAQSADGAVWVAGVGGLDQFDPTTGTITPVLTAQALSGCTASSSLERSDGSVWIGCMDGLVRFDPATRTLARWSARSRKDALPRGAVGSLVEDRDGILWIATGAGLQGRDRRGHVVHAPAASTPEPAGNVAPRLLRGPDGRAWVDTASGIKRWDADAARFEAVPGLPAVATRAFGFSRFGVVWILGDDALESFRWDGSGMVLDGRFAGPLRGVAGVGGLFADARDRVWFTTARGLVRFDPTDASTRVYDTEDGLPSPEFDASAPLVTRDGLVFASTPADFVVFDPGSFASSPIVPEVRLETIRLRRDDQVLELPGTTTRLQLQADDRDLRVTARIASLSEPRSRRFRFRLVGYDRDWVEDKEGERVFTRLEHGTYVLEVCAATADGVWSPPRRLRIVVLPRWWQTPWAYALFALLLAALLLALRSAYRARLRGLHEKQSLEQRRALAEQASEAKSRFLADLGHEIRTPMTGVLGMAELLHADVVEPRQRGRVEAIQAAGQHLLRLVNDALDLARIEAGRLELQDQPFDLHALLVDAAAMLRPQAEAKGLRFALQLAPPLPRGVRGDPVRLRQIVLNLGHNAIKFTEAGSVTVRADAAEAGVRVEIADTGPGIDAASLARLFGRFEQADGARTAARYGGSGLGLAICRELARAMGGDIAADSAPGRGTRFRVTLPLPAHALPEPTPLPPLRVREPGAESLRILVVEDDALVAEVVCDLFAQLGHVAERAAHAMDALRRAAADDFDLIVLDLDLPGLDGFALAQVLRAHGVTAPLVALTARADADAEPRARAAGMVGFVRKPVTGEMLAALVAGSVRAPTAEPA